MEEKELLIQESPEALLFCLEQDWLKDKLPKLEKQFSINFVRKELQNIFAETIKNCDVISENLYEKYDELHKKGVPFSERAQIINFKKLDWLKEYKQKTIKTSKSFTVLPLSAWLREGDYERMKRIGFRKFLRMYYDLAYVDN